MQTAQVVFNHTFDYETLEQLRTLRSTRLTLAENMLTNLHDTAEQLQTRGLVDGDLSGEEFLALEEELQTRVTEMRERLANPEMIYADELTLFTDLIEVQ